MRSPRLLPPLLPLLLVVLLLLGATVATVRADLVYETFRAPPVNLRSGQIANTAGTFGAPLPFIKGPAVIRFFRATVVDDNGTEVPQTELYVHHWLVYAFNNMEQLQPLFNAGPCSNLAQVWGIGAEMRGTNYSYDEPYGIVVTGKEVWGTNLHFIRPGTMCPNVQACIECECPDSNPPLHPKGMVSCCVDGDQCASMQNSTLQDGKNYYLQYTVGYSKDTKNAVPLTVFTYDATAKQTVDCQLEYQIPELAPGAIDTYTQAVNVSTNMSVVFVELHQHVGGVNMTVDLLRDGQNLGPFCHASPRYGNGTEPGNEKDYVVEIPACKFSPPRELLAGDQLLLKSYYSGKTLPTGHPYHAGVMAMAFLWAEAHLTPEDECLHKLHFLCGSPPYADNKTCFSCAERSFLELLASHCTKQLVEAECNKTASGGVVPTPPEVSNMTLKVVWQSDQTFRITVTGPRDVWFAVGYNNQVPEMANATAFVYALPASGGADPVLQERQLANHAPGSVLHPQVPANITTDASGVTIEFVAQLPVAALPPRHTPLPHAVDAQCFLFASGTSLTFDYHGSSRGTSCVF